MRHRIDEIADGRDAKKLGGVGVYTIPWSPCGSGEGCVKGLQHCKAIWQSTPAHVCQAELLDLYHILN